MPDTAIRLAALAAAMSDAELAKIILDMGESLEVTPEQRAALDETAQRLKTRRTEQEG